MIPQQVKPNGGNSATITSVVTTDLSNKCVSFFYIMFSSSANKLNVYLTENQISSQVWSASTDEGNTVDIFFQIKNKPIKYILNVVFITLFQINKWIKAYAQINPITDFQVTFEALLGKS